MIQWMNENTGFIQAIFTFLLVFATAWGVYVSVKSFRFTSTPYIKITRNYSNGVVELFNKSKQVILEVMLSTPIYKYPSLNLTIYKRLDGEDLIEPETKADYQIGNLIVNPFPFKLSFKTIKGKKFRYYILFDSKRHRSSILYLSKIQFYYYEFKRIFKILISPIKVQRFICTLSKIRTYKKEIKYKTLEYLQAGMEMEMYPDKIADLLHDNNIVLYFLNIHDKDDIVDNFINKLHANRYITKREPNKYKITQRGKRFYKRICKNIEKHAI